MADDMIEAANKAAERLENANKINSELIKRLEAIEARRVLGGYSEAVNKQPEMSPQEKILIDTRNIYKGSVIEGAFK